MSRGFHAVTYLSKNIFASCRSELFEQSYPINEYPQINVFEETGIVIQTPGNPEDKIKIGSKIRVFGKITNPITKL